MWKLGIQVEHVSIAVLQHLGCLLEPSEEESEEDKHLTCTDWYWLVPMGTGGGKGGGRATSTTPRPPPQVEGK